MNNRLTLDYGMRFVHQQPQYETSGLASNFCRRSTRGRGAPALRRGCANGVYPCSDQPPGDEPGHRPVPRGRARPPPSARSCRIRGTPRTAFRGRARHHQDRVRVAAHGFAPRFGMAHDLTGQQTLVIRAAPACSSTGPAATRSLRKSSIPDPSERDGALRTAADARGGLTTARAERVRMREQAARVDPVEQRCADGAAVGDGAGRVVCRPAPVVVLQNMDINRVDFGTAASRRTRTGRWPRAPRRAPRRSSRI